MTTWDCGPHANAWSGHDARCRQVPEPDMHLYDSKALALGLDRTICGLTPKGVPRTSRRDLVTCPACLTETDRAGDGEATR